MKAPNGWHLRHLLTYVNHGPQREVNGKWVPARPEGIFSWRYRLMLAFQVLTGQADVVIWPEDTE